MICELEDTSKAEKLFEGWEDSCIYSCLQKVMGKIYVNDLNEPRSAVAVVGCFAFYAGEPDSELILGKPEGFLILMPQDERWAALIEECLPDAEKKTRYAIRKDTQFDRPSLERIASELPTGYELRNIDAEVYDMCIDIPLLADLVSTFGSKEKFLELGRGVVVMRDGRPVAGSSSYSSYREGIEIEVDTVEEERRKGLASAASAALIISCLDDGLYPNWDAANMASVGLAEKLGYEFSHEYVCYHVE